MKYIEFTESYPLLNTRLIEWATARIAGTSDYLEGETRSKISLLQHEFRKAEMNLPVIKRISEFGGEIPMSWVDQEALKDNECRYVQQQLLEAKYELANIKKLEVTPTPKQRQQATEEVKEYIEILQYPSAQEFLRWTPRLSSREKHFLGRLPCMFKTEGVGFRSQFSDATYDWWYLGDGSYDVLTELVEQSFKSGDRTTAFITYNAYDVRCLNAQSVMFVDIDLDTEQVALGSDPWGRNGYTHPTPESEILNLVTTTVKDFDLRFEVYRTAAGMRLIETSREWNPESEESLGIQEKLGCDRLFQNLCKTQRTYRARLEPKPWRDGETVCHHIGSFGNAPGNAIALQIKQIHDKWCLGDGELG
ncbi:hypothetical protein NIES4106_61410 (plasmid) [Fischerella sp. NIES-4106]|nr:hypothetical protein NIES4106_61410 [Fischerella sp. NIES-4106]